MKKLVLIVLLAWTVILVSIGNCIAKNPEIVNPPRPHAKFKWLLVVKHTLYPGHTHFLYTDKYHIFQEPNGWNWILPEGRYKAFYADKGAAPRPDAAIQGIFYSILLSYPEILEHTIFLRSKAPKPLIPENNFLFNDPKKFMEFWTRTKRAQKIKLNAKKAKVIYTTKTQDTKEEKGIGIRWFAGFIKNSILKVKSIFIATE